MRPFAIIGSALVGGLMGTGIGLWLGEREGGDFNIAPILYMPMGAAIGGFVGVVIGAFIFN